MVNTLRYRRFADFIESLLDALVLVSFDLLRRVAVLRDSRVLQQALHGITLSDTSIDTGPETAA
jgi:hypothetical protein